MITLLKPTLAWSPRSFRNNDTICFLGNVLKEFKLRTVIFAIFIEYLHEKNMIDVIFLGSYVGSSKQVFIACCCSSDVITRIEFPLKLFISTFNLSNVH